MGKHFNFTAFSLSGSALLIATSTLFAQSWPSVDSIAMYLPSSMCADTKGRVYLTDETGLISQLSSRGDTLQTYHPASQEAPILLPWQLLRIQAYFPFQQKLVLLDQNLNEVSNIILPETTLGNAAFSADQQLWYLSANFVLNKYNPSLEESTLSTSLQWYLSPESQIILLREYQNRLYIQTSEELLIFDLFGNFLSELPLVTDDSIQFVANEVYFISGQEIHFIDLYSSTTRKQLLPSGKDIRKILVDREYLHGFSKRFWYVYSESIVDNAQK